MANIAVIRGLSAPVRQTIENGIGALHAWFAWLLLLLGGMHMAAALKHHFIGKDDVLGRMLPLASRRIRKDP